MVVFQTIGVPGKSVLRLALSHIVNQSGGKWGSTVTISPHLPIILCTPFAYTDQGVEEKWQTPQLARENQGDKVWKIADAPVSFKTDVWKHFGFLCQEMRKQKAKKKNNTQTDYD